MDEPTRIRLAANPRRYILFTVLYNSRAYYPVLAVLFTDLGLSLERFVLLNLVWAAAIFLFEVPSGALADTLGRKRLLVFSSLLMVAEMLCLLLAPRNGGTLLFLLCLANRVLSGTSEAAASGADEALAYDSLPEQNRADAWDRILAAAMRWRSAGIIVAMILGGLLYDPSFINRLLPASLQIPQEVAHRLPVALVLIQALICTVITLRMIEPPHPHGETGPTLRKAFEVTLAAARWVFTTPKPLVIVMGGVMIDAVIRNVATIQSEYFRLIQIPEWSFGLIGAITGGLGLFVPAIAKRLNQRFSTPGNLALVAVFATLTLAALAPAWKGLAGLVPAMLLIPCMGYLGFTISRALHAVADSSRRATVLSVKGLVFNLGYGACSLAFSTALGYAHTHQTGEPLPVILTWQVPCFVVASVIFFPWAFRTWNRQRCCGPEITKGVPSP
ncbi:MAG: MFS transporter [Luteolibacter sp.]